MAHAYDNLEITGRKLASTKALSVIASCLIVGLCGGPDMRKGKG